MQEKILICQIIVTGVAIATFLASLFIAGWQIASSRKQHRLSIQPLLWFQRIGTEIPPLAAIGLSNKGLGPAIITSATVYLDNKPQDMKPHDAWARIFKALNMLPAEATVHFEGKLVATLLRNQSAQDIPNVEGSINIQGLEFAENMVIASGQDQPVLHIDLPPGAECGTIQKELRRIEIKLEYTDVYRKQTWLARLNEDLGPDQTEQG